MSVDREGFRPSVLEPWEEQAAVRLRALWTEHKHRTGQNQSVFGKATGIGSGGMVSQYINGSRPLGLAAALKFAAGFGVPLDQISPKLAEVAQQLSSAGQSHSVTSNVTHATMGTNRVPLIRGATRGVVDPHQSGDGREHLLTDQKVSKNAFALEIEELDMLPEFGKGDKVIIEPEIRPQPGDYVAAVTSQNQIVFRKYRPRGPTENPNEVFELVPLNEDFPTLRNDISPLTISGTMIEHRRFRKPR